MFAQVIQAPAREQAGLRRQADRWIDELAPGARGWRTATWGVSDEGDYVAIVLFDSEDAARANSGRPEQATWWEQTSGLLSGPATFHDCRHVDRYVCRGCHEAGFVQVVEGRADAARLAAGAAEVEQFLGRFRPEVLGRTVAWHGDGSFTQALYFTSEEAARRAEEEKLSAEDAALANRYFSPIETSWYVDLRDPWLFG